MKSQGSQGKRNCFANVLEIVDITHFISIVCQRIRVINVTFCYTADKLKSGKNIVSQENVRDIENLKIMAILLNENFQYCGFCQQGLVSVMTTVIWHKLSFKGQSALSLKNPIDWLVGCVLCPIDRSFKDDTPIYCPLRRT